MRRIHASRHARGGGPCGTYSLPTMLRMVTMWHIQPPYHAENGAEGRYPWVVGGRREEGGYPAYASLVLRQSYYTRVYHLASLGTSSLRPARHGHTADQQPGSRLTALDGGVA